MDSILLDEKQSQRRMLVAFAHPDDESFGPGGTLARYASQGVAVHLVCGTRGEAGRVEPHLLEEYDSVADLRSEELFKAASHLGLAGVHFLEYQDSGMEGSPENDDASSLHQAPLDEVAAKITHLIRRFRPQVVVTHDPTGGYFHPDHIKMHQAAVLAFDSAGDAACYPEQVEGGLAAYRPQKLYYTGFPRALLKFLVRILPLLGQDPEAFGHNKDMNIKRFAEVDQPVTTRIKVGSHLGASRRAVQSHASQLGGYAGRATRLLSRLRRHDTFTRAYPPPEGNAVEMDLFAGVVD